MKFSLVHPSRQRVEKCKEAINNWTSRFSNSVHTFEYILSVDNDDEMLEEYRALAKKSGANIVINNNTCCVEAANYGATFAKGDIIILVSDDFCPPYNYDIILGAYFKNEPQIFQIDDTITKSIITLPIINRAAYDELKFVYYPEYKSMFADNDLRLVAESRGWLVDITFVKFEHRHWVNNLAEKDDAYIRQNSDEFWKHGSEVFERRKLELNDLIKEQNAKRFN